MENKCQIIHLYLTDGRIIEAVGPPFFDPDHEVGVTGVKVFLPESLPENCKWTKLKMYKEIK